MERTGLLWRRPAETNRRALVVELTETGKSLVPLVRRAWAEIERQTVAGLSEAQRAHLVDGWTRVRAGLTRALKTAPARGRFERSE